MCVFVCGVYFVLLRDAVNLDLQLCSICSDCDRLLTRCCHLLVELKKADRTEREKGRQHSTDAKW